MKPLSDLRDWCQEQPLEAAREIVALRMALARAHAALDEGHDHTSETWADREHWQKRD